MLRQRVFASAVNKYKRGEGYNICALNASLDEGFRITPFLFKEVIPYQSHGLSHWLQLRLQKRRSPR
uniref:Uncharacterized protein n=1 Tax=uncultured nuHF1 cluster bacterium HF0130_24M16 TaxID=723585 RepID=E7C2X5_9BACT|nr:hypothetical protein [uncultured nuHF1 cluster bacterium HF0130_24M16]